MAIPDESLHPVATGKAASLVKEHENSNADHTLYSGWFCVRVPISSPYQAHISPTYREMEMTVI
jgi:hypothetical protein